MSRILADSNVSRKLLTACMRLQRDFPIFHIADWFDGAHRHSKDPVLLGMLREHNLILVSFDKSSLAMHGTDLTRAGLGHAGIILFRRSVGQCDYGKQARLLVSFWRQAAAWDWMDRVEYLPAPNPGGVHLNLCSVQIA